MHRIFDFPLFAVCPSVLQLQLFLRGMQSIPYEESKNLEDVVMHLGSDLMTHTEYFKVNYVDSFARKLLYREFPEHYCWIKG